MSLILFLVKAYIVVLIFRLVLTQQELNFNQIGRGVGYLTNNLFKGASKSVSDRFIPLLIVLLTVMYAIIYSLFSKTGLLTALVNSFLEILKFLSLFFIVCILLGSIASPATGAFPLFFYRIGNLFVAPIRKFLPVKGNKIIVPSIILIVLLYTAIATVLEIVAVHDINSGYSVVKTGLLVFVGFLMNCVHLLSLLSFIIFIRILLSWFSPDPRNMLVQLIYYVTEPVLAPARKIIPAIGMIDISALVVMLAIYIVENLLANILFQLSLKISVAVL